MIKKEQLVSSRYQLLLYALGHFTVDWYSGMLKPLLPLIMTQFALSQGKVAMIPSILGVIAAFTQPLGALLGVHFKEKRIQIISILLASIFTPLIGIAKTVPLLFVFLAIGKIGNSFFHPNGASSVGEIAFKRSHTAMSLFSMGGALGAAAAPIMTIWYVKKYGIYSMPALASFGIIVAIIAFLFIKKTKERPIDIPQAKNLGLRKSLTVPGVKNLVLVITLRTITSMGISTMIPLYVRQLGYDIMWGSYFLTAAAFCGIFGNYIGAVFADKTSPKLINILSAAIAPILGITMLLTNNIYAMLVLYSAMAFVLFCTMGTNVSYMQELLPTRRSIASSLSMGISWGSASIILIGLSYLIDIIGLHAAMFISLAALPVATVVSLKLVDTHQKKSY